MLLVRSYRTLAPLPVISFIFDEQVHQK